MFLLLSSLLIYYESVLITIKAIVYYTRMMLNTDYVLNETVINFTANRG